MKQLKPEFSVIVPVFNSKKTIARAIESILKQNISKEKIEILISVDDGQSYYEFKEICNNIRIIYSFNKVGSGAGKTRNRGIQNALGKFIAFLDADDTWSSNYLDPLRAIARRTGLAFGSTDILSPQGKKILKLEPINNFNIKSFGSFPGSFHPLVIKRFAGPFPNGPSQDVIHAMKLLLTSSHKNIYTKKSQYQLWLNSKSFTSEKNFSQKVEISYRSWREYFRRTRKISNIKKSNEIIRALECRRNWNRLYIKNGKEKKFYEYLAEKLV
tara:strand:- start:208 stop:1020 length:813 start_codon:yes stop_codon:yes gene_type:complete